VGLIANARGSDHARLLGRLETFGRCSMLDVFMVVLTIVAVEVSIISDVTTHAGLYVFTAAVVLSMAGIRRLVGLGTAGPHFTDKTPENFLRIGLIRLALPNARIIHCGRDPVDTCLSCYRRLFVRGRQGFAYDLRELGLEYLRYARLMAHWRMVAPGAIHELQYEDLVADQEGETRRLLAFCGLPFEDACLRFHETERTVETASANQVRQKIYRSAAQRWRHYEKHLGPLLEVLRPNSLP